MKGRRPGPLDDEGNPAIIAYLAMSDGVGPNRPLLVAVAGPGWVKDDLPEEIPLLGNLTDAVRVLSSVL